jgi:hypothetical protein
MPSFTCPKCKKSLKTAAPIPAGKKIKCPACTHVFVMPDLGEETIQVGKPMMPARTAALSSIAKERDRERPTAEMDRPKRRRPDLDDEDEAPRKKSRKAKSRRDDNPDRDEDERRGRRRKKKQKQSNTGLIVILSGAGALVLLLIVVGGFVWPGFFKGGSKARAAAPVDPLAFVPENCEVVAGVSLAQYRNKASFQKDLDRAFRQTNQLSPVQFEFVKNLDRVVFAVANMGPNATGVGVFTSAKPLDPQKVRQVFSAGPAQDVQGKTIYKINDPNLGARLLMSLPDEKTVVFGQMSETNFVRLLDGKNKLPPVLQAKASAISSKLLWMVIDLQAALKGKTEQFDRVKQALDAGQQPREAINREPLSSLTNLLFEIQKMPGGSEAVTAIKDLRLASFFYDYTNELRMELAIQCANEEHAEKIETFAKGLWDQHGKPWLTAVPALMLGKQPGSEVLTKAIDEATQSFQVQRQGVQVIVSMSVSENTVKELEQLEERGGLNAGGFNPGAGAGGPDPGVPNPGVANPGEANPGEVNPAPQPKTPVRPRPKTRPKKN